MKTFQTTYSSNYSSFFNILNSYYPLSDELKEALLKSTYELIRPKGTILFKLDEMISNSYFIVKGIARTYYYNKDKEITNSLCAENRIFTTAVFFSGLLSYEVGELLEDSILIVLPRKAIESVSLKYLELNYIIRKMAEQFTIALEQRIYFLHMKSARERYDNLLKTNPDFFQRIPQGQIASFLGMTQETLSRLKSGINQRQ
jgi:CRP/FNR family transcriptional regulator, anaerobic regulatory protein